MRRPRLARRSVPEPRDDGPPTVVPTRWTSVERPVVYWGANEAAARFLRPHLHPDLEATIILDGEQVVQYQDAALRCLPGDMWFAASEEVHGDMAPGPMRNACLAFSPDFLGDAMLGDRPWLSVYAQPPSRRPRVVSDEQRSTILAAGWQIHREATGQRPGWENAVRTQLLYALLTIARGWRPDEVTETPVAASSLLGIHPALQLVYSHGVAGRRVSLNEAASACAMGRSLFCRAFRQATGFSFTQFELRLRLSVALHLLRTTRLPIEDIASRTGFWDRSHLHRHFTSRYRIAPLAVRRLAAN
ncbi:MAG: AraC family transcriptional regulator [Armatimonadota bacterium]